MRIGTQIMAAALALGLSGCGEMPDALPGLGFLSGASDAPAEVARQTSSFQQVEGETESAIISELLGRRSLVLAGSPYATVADAALAASARAAESELIGARLRAEAQSKNWLPSLGPSVSLTSLGDVVAQILIEQVLFDNGRRKAERAFAAADVEVAAVNLSIDMNSRVETALTLYLTALRGSEKESLYGAAVTRMNGFHRIVKGRVEGGVSDRSDLRVVEGKIDDLASARKAAEESRGAALAELRAMTGQTFAGVPEQLVMDETQARATHLSVLQARAIATRSVAEAKAEKAGLLPGLSAQGKLSDGGTSGGLTVDFDQPLGFGTGATMRAIEAAEDAAGRKVAEAEEDARRSLSRQSQRLASYRRQEAEAAALAQDARTTFELFQNQFRAGQRTVMEVVTIYEKLVEREEAHLDAKYEVVLTQLAMARDLGLLADGEKI